ncbi:MAG: class B sortase [Clostridiales bacterium]|nr:class B sortase [Clostridiales bacterium]
MKTFWKTMNTIYEKTMLVIFVIALLIVVYALYDTWYVFDHANDKSYLNYKPGQVNADASPADSPITQDMVGWITMDDTNIDYPIMQGADNTAYLNRDPYGQYSLAGSIFLDSRNDSAFADPYSVIYGHHMEYGVMFGALDDYLQDDYLRSHTHGELLVGRDGKVCYDLQVFYAMAADAKDEFIFDPGNYEELYAFLEEKGLGTDHRILCLSTCAGDASSTRTVVFAYILDID